MEDRYTVKVVFRGLCLSHVDPAAGALHLYLPEASGEPAAEDPVRRSILANLRPFAEHHAVLEFHQADWENRSSSIPRLLQLTKPNKEPVALYLLREQRVHLKPLYGQGAAELPAEESLLADRERYERVSDSLLLLGKDEENGFDQLPAMRGGIVDDPEEHCAATVALTVGEAFTERRSTKGKTKVTWRETPAPGLGRDEQEAAGEIRAVNLDIAVRFTLPLWNPLCVSCEPLGGRSPADQVNLVLRPGDPRRGITLWIKNRELEAVLQDSDLLPDPYSAGCREHRDELDRDHGLLVTLARQPEQLTILRRIDGDASDCGSGCGGRCDPYP
jgi:hypothetical protein